MSKIAVTSLYLVACCLDDVTVKTAVSVRLVERDEIVSETPSITRLDVIFSEMGGSVVLLALEESSVKFLECQGMLWLLTSVADTLCEVKILLALDTSGVTY